MKFLVFLEGQNRQKSQNLWLIRIKRAGEHDRKIYETVYFQRKDHVFQSGPYSLRMKRAVRCAPAGSDAWIPDPGYSLSINSL